MPFKLNVDEESMKEVIQRVQVSLLKASDSLENDHGFDNGHGMAKWSFIYSDQIGNDPADLVSFKTKRNSWKVTGIIDEKSKTLFFFLSQKNLESRQKKEIRSKVMYYISAISGVCNENFESKLDKSQRREIQLTFGLDFDNEEAHQICTEMLQACPSEIEQFCVVSLDIRGYELVSVKANILNGYLDVLYDEDWSNYITVPSIDDSNLDNDQQEQEQHDVEVPLKKKHKKVSK